MFPINKARGVEAERIKVMAAQADASKRAKAEKIEMRKVVKQLYAVRNFVERASDIAIVKM